MTDTQVTWLTQESHDRLKSELDQLIANRPVIAAEINDRREVLVAPSTQTTVQVTAIVKSSKPPAVGGIYGCGTDVPGYLRAP